MPQPSDLPEPIVPDALKCLLLVRERDRWAVGQLGHGNGVAQLRDGPRGLAHVAVPEVRRDVA
eukprot:3418509-Lingulodinium_polyedra.AAC.1